ncbi:uncharacterized protein LOC109851699 [Pseudomyrmex gracilis]|uniref:uncharacterized protein LOC109851699 n=1 Tax=Pseudomyrmex gracilis TaxID=219809 RepID=UPI0009956A93|nr:uncharacterized protein LOC109851699 [Pseudomyrmex gracilis]
MKTILFTICVLMSVHAAISVERHKFYDYMATCLQDITSNKNAMNVDFSVAFQPIFSNSFHASFNALPKLSFNAWVNTFICAFKKAGVVNEDGRMIKSRPQQYCAEVLQKSENIQLCENLVVFCTNLACTPGPICAADEVVNEVGCKLNNGIMSVFEYPFWNEVYKKKNFMSSIY